MYPPELVAPIREDLVEAGFSELMTAQPPVEKPTF